MHEEVKIEKNKNGVPEAIPMWRAKKDKNNDDPFLNTQFYLKQRWVNTLTMFYVA
jgi:hypothetical protein